MKKIKEILKDVWRNFRLPLIGGTLMFIVLMCYVTDFDLSNIGWFFFSISLASGGGVACIIYALIKFFKK